jgi:hypothetical protein
MSSQITRPTSAMITSQRSQSLNFSDSTKCAYPTPFGRLPPGLLLAQFAPESS